MAFTNFEDLASKMRHIDPDATDEVDMFTVERNVALSEFNKGTDLFDMYSNYRVVIPKK
jgi:hypothetical protein